MKTDYKITRDKFMEFKERDWLIKVCKVESENGKLANRIRKVG